MKTLLEGLCEVNHQQGGTIHQFLGHNDWKTDVDRFQRAYDDFTKMGIEFPSKKSFEKLANWEHITINWR